MKKSILITAATLAYCILVTASCFSQGTAINNSGTPADSSAILDVSSTTQGLLIPRMSEAQKNAVPRPAPSLMIYQTDGTQPGYYFNAGDKTTKNWVYIGADDLGNHTATDSLDMNNKKIFNLATCTQNLDAANKEYVDSKVGAGGSGGCCLPTMISDESATTMNMRGAANYCNGLTEGGYTDWRLPSLQEMWDAISLTTSAIPQSSSTNFFFVKNPYADYYVYRMRISDGLNWYVQANDNYYARCVR